MQCVDRRKESWNHSKIKVLPSTSIVADLAKRLEPSITNQCTPGWPHFIKMRSFLENTRPMIWHYTCTLVETPDDFGSSRLKAEQESKKQWTKTFCQVIGLRKLLCGVTRRAAEATVLCWRSNFYTERCSKAMIWSKRLTKIPGFRPLQRSTLWGHCIKCSQFQDERSKLNPANWALHCCWIACSRVAVRELMLHR